MGCPRHRRRSTAHPERRVARPGMAVTRKLEAVPGRPENRRGGAVPLRVGPPHATTRHYLRTSASGDAGAKRQPRDGAPHASDVGRDLRTEQRETRARARHRRVLDCPLDCRDVRAVSRRRGGGCGPASTPGAHGGHDGVHGCQPGHHDLPDMRTSPPNHRGHATWPRRRARHRPPRTGDVRPRSAGVR